MLSFDSVSLSLEISMGSSSVLTSSASTSLFLASDGTSSSLGSWRCWFSPKHCGNGMAACGKTEDFKPEMAAGRLLVQAGRHGSSDLVCDRAFESIVGEECFPK